MTKKTIFLANPRGFCAGVDRAISIVERALEEFGAPIYVRHEVVHNKFVVDNLREKGAVFIEDLAEVPEKATLIYSAHGVSKAVQEEATARGFQVFDATCPLVTKVHRQVDRLDELGYQIIMIGHKGHPEVEGTMGQLSEGAMFLVETVADVAKLEVRNADKLSHVSQTTLSVDETHDIIEALKVRFPNIRSPHKEDICYATTNRQEAVKELAAKCDIVIVVGSPNSSNSNRLREVASLLGVDAYMVDNVGYLK
ncbi:MAG: 4-hydroxy-3-methylbut-2-enyl diphosphate reductase, partial [Neisseria sp.]